MGALSSRRVELVILCEDRQQEVFIRRFLVRMGWEPRTIRPEIAPPGKGSAKQFVYLKYLQELEEHRRQRSKRKNKLLVMVDGDEIGVQKSLKQFEQSCRKHSVQPRNSADEIAILVPTWNIETWLAYLDGNSVEEDRKDYPKLKNESDCEDLVKVLANMCSARKLPESAPESLRIACNEYREHIHP